MNQITISNGADSVTMPKVKAVRVGAKEVANEKKMASGKLVKEMVGYRATVSAEWDSAPADTITKLLALLRSGGYFQVAYPSPEGDASGTFSVSYPTIGIFAFIGGIPVWHDISLSMEAQEVV